MQSILNEQHTIKITCFCRPFQVKGPQETVEDEHYDELNDSGYENYDQVPTFYTYFNFIRPCTRATILVPRGHS